MHTQSGAVTFAACRQLFRFHPLAITQPPAGSGGLASMVVRDRTAGFFVLTRPQENLFVLRSWNGRDGVEEEIKPGTPVPDLVRQVIAGCLPVPRHGSLFGWVACRQVTALLAVRSAPPPLARVPGETLSPHCDTLGSLKVSAGPEVRVLPLEGTRKEWHWPPFAVSPLDDWRLWEYVEWNELVDVLPLLGARADRAFWVPAEDGRPTGHVVLTDNIRTDAFWLPKGVYCDHWTLREGIEPPSAESLTSSPGAVDLSAAGLW